MGFEIFVSGYERGESSNFSFDLVENAFASAITNKMEVRAGSFSWTIEYDIKNRENVQSTIVMDGVEHHIRARDLGEIYIALDEPSRRRTSNFMVTGIPTNLGFYHSLLTVLQGTHTALFWPGKGSLLIGREDMIEHLPQDMIDTLGVPFLATRPEQIIERLTAS